MAEVEPLALMGSGDHAVCLLLGCCMQGVKESEDNKKRGERVCSTIDH